MVRLRERLAKRPERVTMDEWELRADTMARDLRSVFKILWSQDPRRGDRLVQWAVRTSMEELGNLEALNQTVSELGEGGVDQLAAETGMGAEETERFYKDMGDAVDAESAEAAYVIVECNISHRQLGDPARVAARFLEILKQKVLEYEPDEGRILGDELTPLSFGQRPEKGGALFEARYIFIKR